VTFEKAVRSTAAILDHFQKGLQGIREADRNRLQCADTRRLRGSVDLDEALRIVHPNASRWDYAIGIRDTLSADLVVWIEAHPASSSRHVGDVLKKLLWLREWRAREAPALDKMPARYCWVATGKISFPGTSPEARRIAQQGLRFPTRKLDLDELARPPRR